MRVAAFRKRLYIVVTKEEILMLKKSESGAPLSFIINPKRPSYICSVAVLATPIMTIIKQLTNAPSHIFPVAL